MTARALRSVGLLLGAVIACLSLVLISGEEPVSAQEEATTLDVTVRYADGSLVTDMNVCLTYYYVNGDELQAFAGSNTIPSGPESSLVVPVGGEWVVRAHGCGSAASARIFHNGMPDPGGLFDRAVRALLIFDAVPAVPGANQIDITVGSATISGSVSLDAIDPTNCGVLIWGTATAAPTYTGPVAAPRIEDDGSFEALVPPGTYRIESSCLLRSAYEAWPNRPTLVGATTFTLAHGETQSGVDFDLNDNFDETEGTHLFVSFPDTMSYEIPKCIRAYDLQGQLVREQLGFSSVSVPVNGSYRVQIADCFNLGFGDVWYPNSPTQAGGEVVVVDGSVEIPLEGSVILGPEFLTCNGLDITIRGHGGDDDIQGTSGDDVIATFGGSDVVRGASGADVICSGDGNDRVFGNAGDDWIDAGAGADWVGAGWGEDTVYGGAGNDFIRGFKHNDTIYGGTGNDRITGGWGNDILRGGAGNDILRAYYGADKLFGDAGNDVLVAGNGPDLLVGGPGPADRLFGDQGRDTCNDVGADSRFDKCEKINQ